MEVPWRIKWQEYCYTYGSTYFSHCHSVLEAIFWWSRAWQAILVLCYHTVHSLEGYSDDMEPGQPQAILQNHITTGFYTPRIP